jgi:hypothetical protein
VTQAPTPARRTPPRNGVLQCRAGGMPAFLSLFSHLELTPCGFAI